MKRRKEGRKEVVLPCEGIKTVLFSGFHGVDSGFFFSGTWILDSNYKRDSGFLNGFQKTNIYRIPDYLVCI